MEVLIIEDDSLISELIKEDLEDIGIVVSLAPNAVEAYKILYKRNKYTQFDYIVLDFGLPDENGVEIAKLIKERFTSKLIIYTAAMKEDYEDKCCYDFFIEKGPGIEGVTDIIKNAFTNL